MSWKVAEEFTEHSRSTKGTRLVGLEIAQVAHHDGVALVQQAPTKAKAPRKRDLDKDDISTRANLNERTVRRAIEKLQQLDELEVIPYWDGRVRRFVYRLVVGRIRSLEVDYDRGLHWLPARFWTPEELLLPVGERPSDGHILPRGRVDILSARRGADERTFCPPTSGLSAHRRVDNGSTSSTSHGPGNGPAAAELAAQVEAAAAEELERHLMTLHAGDALREAAQADPQRALAWIELAATEARRNPAGFVIAGLRSGEWPAPRAPLSSTTSKRQAWLEQTAPHLDPETAHLIVEEWDDLDHVELAHWHQELDDLYDRLDHDRRERGAA